MEDGDELNLSNSATSEAKIICEQTVSRAKRKIIKNLTVISCGFLLLFIAYNGLSFLQSTINQKQGIGVASQAIIYAGFCISALVYTKYVIKKLGCKRTLLQAMSCFIPYIAANFYFNWVTMIPSAILLGLNSSLLWSAQCTYFNESSIMYSDLCLKEKRVDKVKYLKSSISQEYGKLNGAGHSIENEEKSQNFSTKSDCLNNKNVQNEAGSKLVSNKVKHSNKKLGEEFCKNDETNKYSGANLCTLAAADLKILHKDNPMTKNDSILEKRSFNDSMEHSKIVSSVTARFFGLFGLVYRTSDIWSNLISYYVLQSNNVLDNITNSGNCSCGASFCNVDSSNCFEHNLAEPDQQTRNILTGVLVVLGLTGILLVFLFLDELETDKQPVCFSLDLAMATLKFASRKEALLLLPLSAYIGFLQAFYIGDFTKSYIACAWGVYHVGLVTLCYGAVGGISSTLAGFLVKHVGRIAVMVMGGTINASINVYLLIWNPLPHEPVKFFLAASMWGASVGILWSQLRAYYGMLFKEDEETAFAGFYLWDSIGYCIAFSYSNYICTYIKIYILLSVSTLGMLGYLKTEFIGRQNKKETNPS